MAGNDKIVVSTTIVAGAMLSPESLVVLGTNMGVSGAFFVVAIAAAACIQILGAIRHAEVFSGFRSQGGEAWVLEKSLGPAPAILLPVCSRIFYALCLSTAVLATAGYVFNEIFLYWFPNFAFAFLLLGFLLTINLLGQRVAQKFQIIFVLVALGGLIFLSIHALSGAIPTAFVEGRNTVPEFRVRNLYRAFVLLVGFELVGFTLVGEGNHPGVLRKSMVAGIVTVTGVLILWGSASVAAVAPSTLQETTIPHIVAAREIWGQRGRVLMGLVVLSGTCGAINVLLMAVPRMVYSMAQRELFPRAFGTRKVSARIPMILMGAAVATMLALGVAGDPDLEIYIRSGLLFYLFNYALVHYCLLNLRRGVEEEAVARLHSPGNRFLSMTAFLVNLTAGLVLLWTDGDRGAVLGTMLIVAGIASLYAVAWLALSRKP